MVNKCVLLQAIEDERTAYNHFINAEPAYIMTACYEWKAAENRLNEIIKEMKGK